MAIEKLSALRTGLGNIMETRNDADKNMCETNDKKSDQRSVYVLTSISPYILCACSVNNRLKTIGTRNPRAIYPVAQEWNRASLATIHTQEPEEKDQNL
jgi:hypothetical protein